MDGSCRVKQIFSFYLIKGCNGVGYDLSEPLEMQSAGSQMDHPYKRRHEI